MSGSCAENLGGAGLEANMKQDSIGHEAMLTITMNAMTSSDTKMVTVFGFYVTTTGVFLTQTEGDLNQWFLAVTFLVTGHMASFINCLFRMWKKDYVRTLKSLTAHLTPEAKPMFLRAVTSRRLPSIDSFFVYVPMVLGTALAVWKVFDIAK